MPSSNTDYRFYGCRCLLLLPSESRREGTHRQSECEITNFGKTVDIANLQHDRHCQNVADAGDRQQILKRLIEFYFLYNRFF